ncbi:MAG: segregation and condensation protein A [Parachlamydiaceae bacterium]
MSVTLSNFSGPLELLYHLVQKKELNIYEIPLFKITEQFLNFISKDDKSLETSAEFLNYSALLIWIKSKALLPYEENERIVEEWEDPHFEIIHHLVDYCKFKEAATHLSQREEKCLETFSRGIQDPNIGPRSLGIEHLTLEDIASLFQEILTKAASNRQTITGETFSVVDKIAAIKNLLVNNPKIPFYVLFDLSSCKKELIAIFLAILELMKLGTIQIIKEHDTIFILKT